VISSNKLEPTTSSILLAKHLAFLSDLNPRLNCTIQANYTAGTTNKNRAHGRWSAISGIEKIVLGP